MKKLALILIVGWSAVAMGAYVDESLKLPIDKNLTPGVEGYANRDTLCRGHYHPPALDPVVERAVFKRYGVKDRAKYKLDHLIPQELGGTNDPKNLWPMPTYTVYHDPKIGDIPMGWKQKQEVAAYFHGQFCNQEMDLPQAVELSKRWVHFAIMMKKGDLF